MEPMLFISAGCVDVLVHPGHGPQKLLKALVDVMTKIKSLGEGETETKIGFAEVLVAIDSDHVLTIVKKNSITAALDAFEEADGDSMRMFV